MAGSVAGHDGDGRLVSDEAIGKGIILMRKLLRNKVPPGLSGLSLQTLNPLLRDRQGIENFRML